MGFPILCEVIREERKDLDVLRTALECLTNAFTSPAASVQAQQACTGPLQALKESFFSFLCCCRKLLQKNVHHGGTNVAH